MFERFTTEVRQVVVEAQEQARLLNQNYIGTEHIVLALCDHAETLAKFGLDWELVRKELTESLLPGEHSASGHIPFTPRSKKVFELGLRESLRAETGYIGVEHLLVGLLVEGKGVGVQPLLTRLDLEVARELLPPPDPAAVITNKQSEVSSILAQFELLIGRLRRVLEDD